MSGVATAAFGGWFTGTVTANQDGSNGSGYGAASYGRGGYGSITGSTNQS